MVLEHPRHPPHCSHTYTPIHPKQRGKDGRWSSSGLAGESGPEKILASRVPRWESWRSGTFEHSSSARGFYPPNIFLSSLPSPHIYIFLGGGLKPPNPVLYPDPRSMAFTYRGRRGEIKMAVRYPGFSIPPV